MNKKYRVIVYVDGYNLFHGIRSFRDDRGEVLDQMQRVDLNKLSTSLLSKARRLDQVYYFSALAEWRPDDYKKHSIYIRDHKKSGVSVQLGHFKKKSRICEHCGKRNITHEEKETDIHIALQMLEDAFDDLFDTAFIMSTDADLVPVIRSIRKRYQEKRFVMALPKPRLKTARDMMHASDIVIPLTATRIKNHQLNSNNEK